MLMLAEWVDDYLMANVTGVVPFQEVLKRRA